LHSRTKRGGRDPRKKRKGKRGGFFVRLRKKGSSLPTLPPTERGEEEKERGNLGRFFLP